MSKIDRVGDYFFIILVLTLIVSASHYLSVQFFAVPVFIGFVLMLITLRHKTIKFDGLHLFFILLFLGVLLRGLINGILLSFETVKLLVLVLYNYGAVRFFSEYKPGPNVFKFVLSIILIWLAYFLIGRILGYDSLTLAQILFSGSSYHIIAWFSLFFVAFLVFFSEGEKYNGISIAAFVALCLLLGGRTGVFISASLLLVFFFFRDGYSLSITKLLLLLVLVSIGSILAFDLEFLVSNDIKARGTTLGPRELIWNCYFENLTFDSLLWGFDTQDLYGCTEPILGRIAFESSYLSLQAYTGFISFFLGLLLLLKVLEIARQGALQLFIVLSFMFRMSTGEFVFITPFDWFILVILFKRKAN